MFHRMQKDFDSWNIKKKRLESERPDALAFRERQIWWCSIGLNLGDEEDGKNELFERPVLIIRKFNNRLAWVLPITTNDKIHRYYFSLESQSQKNSAILSQLRLVSAKRFNRLVRMVSPYEFSMILGRVADLIR